MAALSLTLTDIAPPPPTPLILPAELSIETRIEAGGKPCPRIEHIVRCHFGKRSRHPAAEQRIVGACVGGGGGGIEI